MKIKKPLITLFYVFSTTKIVSMIAATLFPFFDYDFLQREEYTAILLVNFISDNLVASVFLMQWLHLTFSIQLLFDQITET